MLLTARSAVTGTLHRLFTEELAPGDPRSGSRGKARPQRPGPAGPHSGRMILTDAKESFFVPESLGGIYFRPNAKSGTWPLAGDPCA
jgi:hypothetical protein